MKKILITGANSYIGTSFEQWLKKWPNQYTVDTIDMKDSKWENKNFSEFDVVFHVAGIAHCRETKENQKMYFLINKDLAFATAKKAKEEGVKQFVFLSSMSVYGLDVGVIRSNTVPLPKSNYGKSKLQAEQLIMSLKNKDFKIAIIRPPIVYGKGCKGNYIKLSNIALKFFLFPAIENERSMIFINNLCKSLCHLINNNCEGLFFPQNREYVCTSKMVKAISDVHGKNIHMTKLFNPLIKLIKLNTIRKVFGDLVYEKSMSEFINFDDEYNFYQTIMMTEN